MTCDVGTGQPCSMSIETKGWDQRDAVGDQVTSSLTWSFSVGGHSWAGMLSGTGNRSSLSIRCSGAFHADMLSVVVLTCLTVSVVVDASVSISSASSNVKMSKWWYYQPDRHDPVKNAEEKAVNGVNARPNTGEDGKSSNTTQVIDQEKMTENVFKASTSIACI